MQASPETGSFAKTSSGHTRKVRFKQRDASLAPIGQDGLNWHYSATVGSSELLDPTTGEKYGEGPNECTLVLLKDTKTVWAAMRVDGGDGGGTKPFVSATSSDGGVTCEIFPFNEMKVRTILCLSRACLGK